MLCMAYVSPANDVSQAASNLTNECPRRDEKSGHAHTCLIELDIPQYIHAVHDDTLDDVAQRRT